MTGAELAAILAKYRFTCSSEAELGDAIARALTENGVAFEREAHLAPGDRIDFLCGAVGIELKTEGPVTAVFRQLQRYAKQDQVAEIVLATSRVSHAAVLSAQRTLAGKPLHVVRLSGGFL